MIDAGGCLVILIILGLIYAFICMYEEKIDNDYDEVTEAKCKKCINYSVCRRHGCDYECRDYCTEEMLRNRGLDK